MYDIVNDTWNIWTLLNSNMKRKYFFSSYEMFSLNEFSKLKTYLLDFNEVIYHIFLINMGI